MSNPRLFSYCRLAVAAGGGDGKHLIADRRLIRGFGVWFERQNLHDKPCRNDVVYGNPSTWDFRACSSATCADALLAAGVDERHLFEDRASGSRDDRAGLVKALAFLKPGDCLVVWKLDRLAGRCLICSRR